MEPLPKLKHTAGSWKFPRKRRRSNTDHDPDTPNGTYPPLGRGTLSGATVRFSGINYIVSLLLTYWKEVYTR